MCRKATCNGRTDVSERKRGRRCLKGGGVTKGTYKKRRKNPINIAKKNNLDVANVAWFPFLLHGRAGDSTTLSAISFLLWSIAVSCISLSAVATPPSAQTKIYSEYLLVFNGHENTLFTSKIILEPIPCPTICNFVLAIVDSCT